MSMFRQKAIDVLVYTGDGVSALCLSQTLNTFRSLLGDRYSIVTVDSHQLATEPWEKTTFLLTIPGGRDLPYNRDLSGTAANKIRNFVYNGGLYIGFCAGGYFASSRCVFEPNSQLSVIGERPLHFFPNICKGAAYPGFKYNSEECARAVKIQVQKEAFKNREASKWLSELNVENPFVYYNGGGYFVNADSRDNFLTDYGWDLESNRDTEEKDKKTHKINVLARYPSDVTDPEDRGAIVEDAAAIVACNFGRGMAVLSGVHIEFSHDSFLSNGDRTVPQEVINRLISTDRQRKIILVAIFQYMGLDVKINIIDECTTKPMKQITPTFVIPIKDIPISETAKFMYKLNSVATNGTIDDTYNKIIFQTVDSNMYHHTTQVTPNNPTNETEEKSVIQLYICNDKLPSTYKSIYSFDIEKFTHYIKKTNASVFGNWLMYTEVTTSTQTFLEK
ncbi:hypothetical protein BB558_001381 [Smittium angustum]|uniref:Biotin-protein ligase N-terminal domain-containing protein n=1 Tax=Smittium angustum TaxID=133377 RepID=A0A2U1JBH9_SMIAN|nr:hypothetical protein BB558_001381 [Smittium angustum]